MQHISLSHFAELLGAGEIAASNAARLNVPQRNALMACALAGRLHRFLSAWHADGTPALIAPATVAVLQRHGLMTVAGRNARLTANGKWYARTLHSAQLAASNFLQGESINV